MIHALGKGNIYLHTFQKYTLHHRSCPGFPASCSLLLLCRGTQLVALTLTMWHWHSREHDGSIAERRVLINEIGCFKSRCNIFTPWVLLTDAPIYVIACVLPGSSIHNNASVGKYTTHGSTKTFSDVMCPSPTVNPPLLYSHARNYDKLTLAKHLRSLKCQTYLCSSRASPSVSIVFRDNERYVYLVQNIILL